MPQFPSASIIKIQENIYGANDSITCVTHRQSLCVFGILERAIHIVSIITIYETFALVNAQNHYITKVKRKVNNTFDLAMVKAVNSVL